MIQAPEERRLTARAATAVSDAGSRRRRLARRAVWFGRLVRHYPLPFGVLVLLLASLGTWLAHLQTLAEWSLIAVILLGGIPLLWATLWQLAHREIGVDVIAILAISGSLILGQYLAGAIIVLMLSGGAALEAFALRRAGKSLSRLAERAPRTAHVWHDQQLTDIPADQVEREQIVVVKPGEIIPVDGLVISGTSGVSEADLTGEPLPVSKAPGTQVLSGSVNQDHMLEVRALKRSAESQYAQGLTAASAIADAVLLSPDILQVVSAVELGRRIMRVALQGIWIGIGLSLVAMVCAAFGLIPPAMGALLQEGIDVLVILNALRATRT